MSLETRIPTDGVHASDGAPETREGNAPNLALSGPRCLRIGVSCVLRLFCDCGLSAGVGRVPVGTPDPSALGTIFLFAKTRSGLPEWVVGCGRVSFSRERFLGRWLVLLRFRSARCARGGGLVVGRGARLDMRFFFSNGVRGLLILMLVGGLCDAGLIDVTRVNWVDDGNLATERHDLVEALRDYGFAIGQLPQSPIPRYDRALTYMRLGRTTEALADVRLAIALDYRFGDGYALLAHLLEDTGALVDADVAASRAIDFDLGRVDYRLRRADISLKRGHLDAAASDFDAVLAREPANLEALRGLAGVRLGQHRERDVVVLLQRYLKASKEAEGDADVTVALSSLLIDGKAYGDALQYLDAHPVDRPDAVRNRARALDGLGRHDEAVALLKKTHDPENSRILGEIAFAQQHCDVARDAFQEAARAAPTESVRWNDLAAASLCANDFRTAAYASARAVELDPTDAKAFRYRANALRGIRDLPGSIRAAHRALDLGGDEARLLMMVGIDEYTIGKKRLGYLDYKRGCDALTDPASADARACSRQLPNMRPR